MRLKNGQIAFLECTISFCYKWVVGTCRIIDSVNVVDFWSRNALSEAIYLIDEDGVTIVRERMVYKRSCDYFSSITYQDPFNYTTGEMEMRAAFVLNHYTERCDVIFCTESVEWLFGLNPKEVVGSTFFQYIHVNDLEDVYAEIDDLKSTGSITKCYFTISCPKGNIEVEMHGIHTRDGLAIIVREDKLNEP
ncbi:hypothetical protein K493DRAFT_319344 [Basidiobolus meristosporus CBS 931.73]|uniref:PAS domain-containing protein n=1 Tax=Basidiobolus meristosporus CBS 931.73 TaxID=1314790 RepID=A0A1Y1XS98_9FUNG|nr:hypothetical protein K493DRAFT_319344 [Basidiobolus meristosporus CBS 931.73]|eukprot:ORX88608.1 hypothetical protein K493DRAFT_319344 [Basidiobolus meristosporus CBS 931.73]